MLEDQNLIHPFHPNKAMGNYQRRASLHEQVESIQPNDAARGIPEAEGQPDQSTLAHTGGTNDRNPTTLANAKGNALYYLAFVRLIGEMDILKLQRVSAWRRQGSHRLCDLGSGV